MDLGLVRTHLPACTAGLLTILTRGPPVPVVVASTVACSCDCSGVGQLAAAGLLLTGAGLALLVVFGWRALRWGVIAVRSLRERISRRPPAPASTSSTTSPLPQGYVISKKA